MSQCVVPENIDVGGVNHCLDLTVSLTVSKLCQTFMFPLRMNQDDFGDRVSLSPTDLKTSPRQDIKLTTNCFYLSPVNPVKVVFFVNTLCAGILNIRVVQTKLLKFKFKIVQIEYPDKCTSPLFMSVTCHDWTRVNSTELTKCLRIPKTFCLLCNPRFNFLDTQVM